MKCRRCAFELGSGAKFCSNCGTAVAANVSEGHEVSQNGYQDIQGERKFVTVLFADVKGSTALIQDRDPEETRALLEPVLKILLDSIEEFGGTVIKSAGDGVMALFGAPIALEHHVLRACYAALAIQKRIDSLHNDISIRVGLNAGEVVVDVIGSGARREYDALGAAVNLAARLEQTAEPKTIQLSADTFALVQDKVKALSLGNKTLKGFNHPVHVYQLQSVLYDYTDLQTKKLSPFVARETEQGVFKQKVELVRAGKGQVLALRGNPGIGKSRLIYEFSNSPEAGHFTKYEGHGFLMRMNVPFYSLKQLVNTIFALKENAHAENKIVIEMQLQNELQGLQSKRFALYTLANIPVEDESWNIASPQFKAVEIMDALIETLLIKSKTHGLMLTFDDVQWMDNESLVFLGRLFEKIQKEKIMVMLAYRSDFNLARQVDKYFTEIQVSTLDVEAMQALENKLLGNDSNLQALKEQLTQTCEGNPYFLEEMILSLRQNDILSGNAGHYQLKKLENHIVLPQSIQAVMASRVDNLTQDQKKVLLYSSVIGKHILVSLLDAVVGIHDKNLNDILNVLTQKEFLTKVKQSPEEYGFVNNITMEVVYNSLLKDTKKHIHLNVLEQLEHVFPDETAQIDIKAIHAFKGEEWAKAFKYNALFGEEAFKLSAAVDALTILNRAFVAYEHLTPTPEINALFITCRSMKFHLCLDLLRMDEIDGIFQKPIEIARAENNLSLSTTLTAVSTTMVALLNGEYEKALNCYFETITIAEKLKDENLIALVSAYATHSFYYLGQHRKTLECFNMVRRIRGENMQKDWESRTPILPISTIFACFSACELGDIDTIKNLEKFILKIVSGLQPSIDSIIFKIALVTIYLFMGDSAQSRKYIQACNEDVQKTMLHIVDCAALALQGYLLVLENRLTDAENTLNQAVIISEKFNFFFIAGIFPDYITEGYIHCHAVEKAKNMLNICISLVKNQNQKCLEAQVLRLKGELALEENRATEQEIAAYFEQSITIATALELKPQLAHNYRGLFNLYKKTGDKHKAQEAFNKAMDLYKQLQMQYWVAVMGRLSI